MKLILDKEISILEVDSMSRERKSFLEKCIRMICEAVDIEAELFPSFNQQLWSGGNPFNLLVYSSRDYDAEVSGGDWCYIDSVATKKSKAVEVRRANRDIFIFKYKGQTFKMIYGDISKSKKR